MPITITLEGFPDDLYRRINERAQQRHTSPDREIITCLEESLGARRPSAEAVLAQARLLRKRVQGRLTEEALQTIKHEGRP